MVLTVATEKIPSDTTLLNSNAYNSLIHFYTSLGEFAKMRTATISFLMSVCVSVRSPIRMEQLGSHWTKFHEISYVNIFRD